MDGKELFDTDIVASVIKVLDPLVPEVVHVELKEEERDYREGYSIQEKKLVEHLPQVSERDYCKRLEYALKGEEPFNLEQQYVIDVLTRSKALEGRDR